MSAKFEIHFHAPVGQNINNVEHMDVHVDKDGNIQVLNAEQLTTIADKSSQSAFKLEDKRGPKFQFLFVDEKGNEDDKRTKEEADRFKRYLQDYNLASVQLNSSKRNDVLKVIICFCKKWVGKGFTTTPISPTALTRFLIDICGIDKKVDRVSIANALLTMLNSGEYDKDIYSRVCEYF